MPATSLLFLNSLLMLPLRRIWPPLPLLATKQVSAGGNACLWSSETVLFPYPLFRFTQEYFIRSLNVVHISFATDALDHKLTVLDGNTEPRISIRFENIVMRNTSMSSLDDYYLAIFCIRIRWTGIVHTQLHTVYELTRALHRNRMQWHTFWNKICRSNHAVIFWQWKFHYGIISASCVFLILSIPSLVFT